MNDETNVVDFMRRATQMRGMRMAYLLSELNGSTVKEIFDAAFIAARVDYDGDCIVDDDMTLVVSADSKKELLKVFTFFPSSGTWEQALAFCNQFNERLIMVRAQVRDTANADGKWTVIFDYDRLVFEDERIEARAVVKTVRRFQTIVRSGISQFDEHKIF